MRLSSLRHDLGRKVRRLFLDALAHHEERVGIHPGFFRGEHLLDGLRVVLEERLAEQRPLAEKLADRTFHDLGDDLGWLAGVLRGLLDLGFLDTPLVGHDLLWNLRLVQIRRLGEGDVHRHILADVIRPLEIDQHADLRPGMHVKHELALRLHALEAADGDVLAELLHQLLALVLFRRSGIAFGDGLGERAGERHEIVVLGDEVGLGVQLDQRTGLCIRAQKRADHAFGRYAARGLARLGAALDAQQLLGLLQVAACLGERLLALHHSEPGQFAQLFHQACTDLCHSLQLLRLKKRGSGPLFSAIAGRCYSDSSPSSTSTNSSREAATTSSSDWVRPSSTASAMPRAYRRMARLESSLPGITYWMPSGLWLVSTTPITGTPSLFASCTAPFW